MGVLAGLLARFATDRSRTGAGGFRRARRNAAAHLVELQAEVDAVARYVATLRREIAALGVHGLVVDTLPETGRDLEGIETAIRDATERMIEAAEELLATDAYDQDERRARVRSGALRILEACSIQDLVGQRLGRVRTNVALLERRLGRFARSARAADAPSFDPDAIRAAARRDVLMTEGPSRTGSVVPQGAIDRLFA